MFNFKEICKCSASCTFVSEEYLQGTNDDPSEIISMRTFSRLVTPIPGYKNEMESREGAKSVLDFEENEVKSI